ncbi:MAG: hypothetical protein JOY61_10850, partial [Chloroflexi bacterium]|nr:hypothetical protein [Chloroflexota bacterium]
WWCQLAIDVNNALCGAVGTQALQDLVRMAQTLDPSIVIALLIYLAMFLLLILQQLMRLALVDVLVVLAPLAALCWILPQTHGWARLWGSLFVGTVFAQFVQVLALALALGMGLLTSDAPRGPARARRCSSRGWASACCGWCGRCAATAAAGTSCQAWSGPRSARQWAAA